VFYSSQTNLFKHLPWQLVKGEHLLVYIPDFYPSKIVSGDTTISPTEEKDVFYAGGTYEWNNTDPSPSKEGREELEGSLKKMLSNNFKILDHRAAIRPAVKDRRPFIGFHQEHSHVGIFNGMGTKGFSLSPYFANHLAEHLVNGKPLNSEVDIKRFLV
jgi:glycine/D-amino acid oxidase-like deaminating enzyme